MLWSSRSRRKFELDRTGICSQIGCQLPVIRIGQRIAHEQLSTTKRNSKSLNRLPQSRHLLSLADVAVDDWNAAIAVFGTPEPDSRCVALSRLLLAG